MMRPLTSAIFYCLMFFITTNTWASPNPKIQPGAERLSAYLPLLKNKKVALVINQTSQVGTTSLLDTLLKEKVAIKKIFVPEHGFRGTADAGASIKNDIDSKTGLPVLSLYGKNKIPQASQLQDVDIVLFDLQDVGTRFYTYISTLEYLMDACATYKKHLIVLDRPNPNGHYIDGPVLESSFKSFVGMQPIPVVYGMTIGEYARMLQGENWIKQTSGYTLTVIACSNYSHKMLYQLPIPPSPNLKEMNAVYLYPSLCFFEGTVISVGRGTDKPFQQWGNPELKKSYSYSFIPKSVQGAANPLFEGQACYGQALSSNLVLLEEAPKDSLCLTYLMAAYQAYPHKEKFFNNFFDKLAGNATLKAQIIAGTSEAAIRQSWEKELAAFKIIRKKYLLYQDFE